MVTAGSNTEQRDRWIIDIQWYEQNNRSFIDLAQRGVCAKCVEKFNKKKKKPTQSEVFTAIKDCCSKLPEFISVKLPILESVFRILLANGNKPMAVEEIGRQLSERRSGDMYAGSAQLLSRLLANDRWYGFKKVTEG